MTNLMQMLRITRFIIYGMRCDMADQKSDYEIYLEKYCASRGVPREEAERHYLVKEYRKVCEEREKEHEENLCGGSNA